MTMTYAELIKEELRLEKEKARLAEEKARFKDGLLLCGNRCGTPASASLSIAVGWIGCAPCITGESKSFDDEDLVLEERP
jgi:hypothetical protein